MPALTPRHPMLASAALSALLSVPPPSAAQEAAEAAQCQPDEVDMGDYCMKMTDSPPGTEDPLRRVTHFPARSLMPGRVGNNAGVMPRPAAQPIAPPVSQPAPQPVPEAAKPVPGPASTAPEIPVVVITDMPPAPVVAQGGYGIQFGAFSTRAAAVRAATAIREFDTGVVLSPAQRNERILWIALAGPFANESDARDTMQRLQATTPMDGAWVKPLKGMTLEGISNDPSPE